MKKAFYPVVGLCGLAGSGKSTVASALSPLGYERVRLAGPLKDMLRALGLSERDVDGDLKEVPSDFLRYGRGRPGSPEDMLRALGLSEAELSGAGLDLPCAALLGRKPRWAVSTLLWWGWQVAGLWLDRGLDRYPGGLLPQSDFTPRHAMRTLGTEWGRDLIHPDLWLDAWERRARAALASGDRVVCDDVRFPNEADAIRRLGGTVIRVTSKRVTEAANHVSERMDFAWDGEFTNDCPIGAICLRITGKLDGPVVKKLDYALSREAELGTAILRQKLAA